MRNYIIKSKNKKVEISEAELFAIDIALLGVGNKKLHDKIKELF